MYHISKPGELQRKINKVSIVMPAYNEEEGIGGTIRAIPKKSLNDMGYDVEVLVIDNNSTDKTSEIARKAGARVVFEPVQGYGRAYKTGFSSATGDAIITTDADSTYPIKEAPYFLKILEEENLDFITTNRFGKLDKNAMSLTHNVGNRLLSLTARMLFQVNIVDSQSGMWIFRKWLLDRFLLRSDGMAFSEEIKLEASYFSGCRWKEIPIQYMARQGQAKIGLFSDGFDNLFSLVKKRIKR